MNHRDYIDPDKLRPIKELAACISRSRGYVSAMKKAGFQMPGGLASVNDVRRWLAKNPEFTFHSVYVAKTYGKQSIVIQAGK